MIDKKSDKKNDINAKVVNTKNHPDIILPKNPFNGTREKLIAIGSSTGGIEALHCIFSKLPRELPPIVMVQHIPKMFSGSFVKRLNASSEVEVFEVNDAMQLQNGCAYLANGDNHLLLKYEFGKYVVRPVDGLPVTRHKPSVDVLFRSVNNVSGKNALGIILTGMGDDGAIGIKELFDNGAFTIAQDEKSCVVFGMPKKAIEAGGISRIVGLDEIPNMIIDYADDKGAFAHRAKS